MIDTSEPTDWRRALLGQLRALILAADPGISETVKWRKPSNPDGVPVWECGGIICTGETYRDKVKLTFAKGAKIDDPAGLFNASLDGGTRRAIDLREGDSVDAAAFTALVRAAVAANAKEMNETDYLLASPANKKRLLAAVEGFNTGNSIKADPKTL